MATNALHPFRPGRSPFDDIMHAEEDGTEWWSAREMMPYLGYARWENLLNVIDKARAACRNTGHDPSAIFHDITKYSEVVRKSGFDIHMPRFGCYLVALNGDPYKPEVAAAQRYFAVMTRAAEIQASTAVASPSSPLVPRPWSERFRETLQPHVRFVNIYHSGCFTVVTTLIGYLLSLEDELIRHLLQPQPSDRPDNSIGRCWASERRTRNLAPVERYAPLRLPDQEMDVMLAVYEDAERGTFESWFYHVYPRDKLPNYLIGKRRFRVHGELPPASAADHTCLGWSGQPANLKPHLRKQLIAVGGFFPAGATPPALKGEQLSLFDLFG